MLTAQYHLLIYILPVVMTDIVTHWFRESSMLGTSCLMFWRTSWTSCWEGMVPEFTSPSENTRIEFFPDKYSVCLE